MNYCSYIIKSGKTSKYYIGSCGDIDKRLQRHNAGMTKSTKNGVPWKLVCVEEFETRQDACRRERQVKSYKGGNAFKKLIDNL